MKSLYLSLRKEFISVAKPIALDKNFKQGKSKK
jgi:hypothetical protein